MPKQRKRAAEAASEDLIAMASAKKGKRKSVEKNVIDDKSLFGKLITKSGAVLRKQMPNMLNCDQAVFQQNLKRSLKFHSLSTEEAVDEFIKGLENHLEDNDNLKWSLLYSQTSPSCENARRSQQDSIIRIMLNIDELQPRIISLLTEKFFIVVYDDSQDEKVDLPRLILASLQWLDHVVDQEVLTAKIKDMLDASPIEVQIEIIGFIPDILDDASHSEISKVLFEMYDANQELTSSVLDTLSCMTLPEERLTQIHRNVLKTLHAVKGPNIAIVVNFLLHHTPQRLAAEILSDLREKICLPGDTAATSWSLTQQQRQSPKAAKKIKEYEDYETLLFGKIKSAVLIFRYLTLAWLKVIHNIADMEEFKNFDLLMLILLYEVVPSRRKAIEGIFRNKIRAGLATDSFLKPLFTNHSSVLKEYFDALKWLCTILTRSSEPAISNYGIAMYRYAFLKLDSFRREVISSLLTHLCDNSSIKMATLTLLSELAHEHTDKMIKYTIFLKGALDVIDLLDMREAKKLMDAVIHLTHAEWQSSLESELLILVKKQLCNPDIKFKRLGVLSAVLILKNFSNNEANQEDHEMSELDEDSPLGQQKEIFQLVCSCTQNSPLSSALFYDELASNILKNCLNQHIEKLIEDKMTDEFEETFVVDIANVEEIDNSFMPVSCQYSLEDVEDKSSIALNLAPMIFQAHTKLKQDDCISHECSVYMLLPHFRLLRMVESHLNEGDLGNIDALLGCPVIAPIPSIYEKFSSHSLDEQHVALTCLFFLINWFRELINAFAMQNEPDLKIKLIRRLRETVDLQALLSKLLPLCPSYVPPPAVFDYDLSVPVKKIIAAPQATTKKAPAKRSKKKGKSTEPDPDICPTMNSEADPVQSQVDLQPTNPSTPQAKAKPCGTIDLVPFRGHFRELHLDVFNLLFRSPTFDTHIPSTSGPLTMPEAEFLLGDLNAKLSKAFDAGTKRTTILGKSAAERDIGFSYLDLFGYKAIAEQSHRFIKPVVFHLEKIAEYFQELITENDGVEDAPNMFTDQTAPIMKVNTMLFNTLKIFFGCPNLVLPEHEHILLASLKIIMKKSKGDSATQIRKEDMIDATFKYISKFRKSILSIETAVSQILALQAIASLSQDAHTLKEDLVKDIERLLQKEWYTTGGSREKSALYSRHIEILLSVLFQHTTNPLKHIQNFATKGIKELAEGKDHSDKYPTLNKSTLLVYYKSLFENLVKGLRKELSSCSELSEGPNTKKQLEQWHSAIKVFAELVGTLKIFSSATMISTCLRHSKGFLDIFLRFGMPLLNNCLKSDQQDVVMLIKNLQASTRLLQNACTHSKVKQDLTLMKHVPFLKKYLESIIYRVKAMLIHNGVSEAFWMGNLKNRDLQGDEILSQSAAQEESEEGGGQQGDEESESDVDLDEEDQDSKKETDYEDDTI